MKPFQWIWLSGILLCISGLVHGIVWPFVGGAWTGPLSIRKPILFGVSTGVTMISLGWIHSKLKRQSYDVFIGPLFAVSMLLEVGLITLQYWRGEASHFNHGSNFDASVNQAITALISIACFVIVDLTRRSFSLDATSTAMKLAIQFGLALLIVSCALGFFNHFYGEYLLRLGRSPETYGESGVMKFPHGVAIHAIQLFPMLVWLAKRLGMGPEQAERIIVHSMVAMSGFLVFSMVQTFTGRARFDLGLVGGALLIFSAGVGLSVVVIFFQSMANGIRTGNGTE